jgi:DNA repair exonuclease SbcCD nuclease subunit
MQFIHTADWQIGMKAAGVGAAGAAVRKARLDSAQNIVSLQADFLLLAGDTFEDNAIDRALVQRTGDLLASFRGPVYLLPGNHDPLVPGSVWDHPVWGQHANLHVIRRAGVYPVPGGSLVAGPLTSTHSRQDPTSWMDGLVWPAGIVIGCAHGTVEGVSSDAEHHPIPRDAWKKRRLDYLALGHWHSCAFYTDGAQRVRMAYSGTHEPTRFGERESGQALRVTISETTQVERIPTAILRWLTLRETLRAPGDLKRLRDSLAALDHFALVRLSIEGLLYPDESDLLPQIHDIASRFLFASIEVSVLPPATDKVWLERIPVGPVRHAAVKLRDAAADGDTTAAAALLALQSLVVRLGR